MNSQQAILKRLLCSGDEAIRDISCGTTQRKQDEQERQHRTGQSPPQPVTGSMITGTRRTQMLTR